MAKVNTLTDAFDSYDTSKWLRSSTSVTVDGRLNMPAQGASTEYLSYASVALWDLTESSVTVEFVEGLQGATSASADFDMRVDDNNGVLMWYELGYLKASRKVANSYNDTTVPWDATAMRYWRIRHAGGTVFWETSPDRTTWTIRKQDADIPGLATVQVRFAAGKWDGAQTTSGTARFDNLNTTGTTVGVTPGTPILAAASAVTSSGFTSSWSAASNATDYLVQRRTGAAAFATVATVSGTSYAHTGLAGGTAYDVRIIARNGTLQGTASNVVSTTPSLASGPGRYLLRSNGTLRPVTRELAGYEVGSTAPTTPTTPPVVVASGMAVNTYSGLTWGSGSAGQETPNGKFATWRGRQNDLAVVHVDGNDAMVDLYPFYQTNSYDYPTWARHIDISIGAFGVGNQGAIPTESWKAASEGAYDARWTASLQNMRTMLHSRTGPNGQPPKVFIRFAHEWNADFYPWGIADSRVGTGGGVRPQSTIAHFKAGWARFRALQRQHYPEAFVVCNVNREQVGVTDRWDLWMPDADTFDVYGVDIYNNWPAAWTAAQFDADLTITGSWNSIKGMESHRLLALSLGKPFSISEWGAKANISDRENTTAVDPLNPGDEPVWIEKMWAYFQQHAGTGPGKLLYEGYWNSLMDPGTGYPFHLLTDPDTTVPDGFGRFPMRMPRSAAKYRDLWSGVVGPQPLPAPTGLVTSAITPGGWTMTCGAVTGAVQYEWLVRPVGSGQFIPVARTSSPTYALTGRTGGTAYEWRVLAINTGVTLGIGSAAMSVTTTVAASGVVGETGTGAAGSWDASSTRLVGTYATLPAGAQITKLSVMMIRTDVAPNNKIVGAVYNMAAGVLTTRVATGVSTVKELAANEANTNATVYVDLAVTTGPLTAGTYAFVVSTNSPTDGTDPAYRASGNWIESAALSAPVPANGGAWPSNPGGSSGTGASVVINATYTS